MILRDARPEDAISMAAILNAVIAIGGTTAHERTRTAEQVLKDYIAGPDVLSSVVCLVDDKVVGWQSVGMWQGDPHIGSFVQPGVQAKGVGSAMFALTCNALRAAGIAHIVAHIRADNLPGLAYYARIGFRDIGRNPDFALQDGRKVGQIHRRYDL